MCNWLWIAYPDLPVENKWRLITQYCESLIDQCNWTQVSDSGLTFAQQTAWLNYRQALREVKETYATPEVVVLPDPPEGAR
jgi:hypothetical protein